MAHRRSLVFIAAVALAGLGPVSQASAADTAYGVLLAGRPVDRDGDSGILRERHVFVNLVKVTRALAGVITFHDADRSTLVTIGSHSIRFTVGSRQAEIDNLDATLTATPFVANGDTFVPLDALAKVAGTTFTVDRSAKLVLLAAPVDASVAPVSSPAASAPAVPAPAAT